MANAVDFTFSDLIAGYITSYDKTTDSFGLKLPMIANIPSI